MVESTGLVNRRVSLITVTFNSVTTIRDTLAAVAAQTVRPFEHIVVDGGSTDGTAEVLSKWNEHRITWSSGPDRGMYDAMNKGIGLSTGEIIGFLNADDVYADRQVLADIAERMKDPLVDAVFGDLDYVTKDGLTVVRHWQSHAYRPGDFFRGWLPPHPTLFVRRSVYQRLGGFDLSYGTAADFDLMNRFFTRGRVRSVYIPRTLVRMRIGGMSNHSWRSVVRAQIQNARSLISTFGMVPPAYPFLKLADRLRQFRRARRLNDRKSQ